MYIKWARCPHCGKTIKVTVEPGGPVNFRLGEPKIITCPRCGRQFTDGSREWEQMDALGKSREALLAAFGGLFIAPLIGAVVGAGLGVLIGSENLWFPGTCAALASAAYFYGFRSMILASKDRTSVDRHRVDSVSPRNAATSSGSPNTTALLAPLGSTQAIFEEIRRQAGSLCRRLQSLHGSDAGADTVAFELLVACVAFSSVATFRRQILKNPAWPKTDEFSVVYGQVRILLQSMLTSKTVPLARFDRMDTAELQRIFDRGEIAKESRAAGEILSQMEAAFLTYVDTFGRVPYPERPMFDVFFVQASTPAVHRNEVAAALAELLA